MCWKMVSCVMIGVIVGMSWVVVELVLMMLICWLVRLVFGG